MTEEELAQELQGAKSGDGTCLERLCREAKVRLQLVVKYRLGSWSQADREDLVQDALVTFCEKIEEIDRTPMAFALWILRQKIGNEFQKARRIRERSFSEVLARPDSTGELPALDPPDLDADPAAEFERKETTRNLRSAIGRLSGFCRIVFTGLLEGMRMQEIWMRYHEIEPGLQRSAFDKRTHACRRKLYALIGAAK